MQQNLDQIRRQGFGLAAVSYDSVAVLHNFATRRQITYPLLSDPDSKIIRGWGILNDKLDPKSPSYGVPYPGTYVIAPNGKITARFFEDDFRERTPLFDVLQKVGAVPAVPRASIVTPHLKVAAGASSTAVYPYQRISLFLDLSLGPGMHVYAPGVTGYIPIAWTMQPPSPEFRFDPVQAPAARKLHLPVINETVPVYAGDFRLIEDVVLPPEAALKPLLNTEGEFTIHGSLRYQACDDHECYLPASIPLEWKFRLEPLDRERVPEELRRKAE